MWTSFNWLKMGPVANFCQHNKWHSGSIKDGLAELLRASQEIFCSVELIG